jgi:hypothetical protein
MIVLFLDEHLHYPHTRVLVLAVGLLRGELFQPDLIVLMEAAFIIINKDTRGNVHRVDEGDTLDALRNEALSGNFHFSKSRSKYIGERIEMDSCEHQWFLQLSVKLKKKT